jgi:beta-phosphoglucomutase
MQSSQPFRYDMVLFDVGGTLLGFHDPAPFQAFLAGAGLPDGDNEVRRLQHRLHSAIRDRRASAQGLGADGRELDRWWHETFLQTWPDRPDLAAEMSRWLRDGRLNRPFADTLPALEALARLGMPVAVVSNWGTELPGLLQRLDLLRFFEFVIVSAELGLAKPDPRIFEPAVAQAGVEPGRLLYVGDHVGDDVEGAWAAGLDAVLVDRYERHPAAHCARIDSLLELVDYIHPPTSPARAIIFDMDGVVLDSPPFHLLTWQRALAPLGIELAAGDLFPLEGMPTERTARRLTQNLSGKACSHQEARRLAATKRALFRDLFDPAFVPGIVPLLYDLRGRGYRLALVTGSAQSVVDESLVPTGVDALFEVIVSGDQVSLGKPAPEPYELAAAGLGLPPARCLVVENAPLGIRSARAAGMDCVALETTLPAGQLAAAGAEPVFPDVPVLRAWLLPQT